MKRTGHIHPSTTTGYQTFGAGLALLICGDIIRPDIAWLLRSYSPTHSLAAEMARVHDPDGFAMLHALTQKSSSGRLTSRGGIVTIANIAAKGGIGAGRHCRGLPGARPDQRCRIRKLPAGPAKARTSYTLLHTMGVFPPDAPSTARMFSPIYQVGMYQGQLTPEQLIDRYDLGCRPVRDLLVDYVRERQPGVASTPWRPSQETSVCCSGRTWRTITRASPRYVLAPTLPPRGSSGSRPLSARHRAALNAEARRRKDVASCLNTVRAFYLDIAQWAAEDPTRWARWAVPAPSADDIRSRKERGHRKSRMDQRTRERIPALPTLIANIERARRTRPSCLRPPGSALPVTNSLPLDRGCTAR